MAKTAVREIDRLAPLRRYAWLDWLTAHGIDPKDVPVPTLLTANRAGRKIRYLGFARDDHGELMLARRRQTGREQNWVKREWKTVQLDRSPAPFPEFAR